MVIYVDVLLFINLVIDYILLSITQTFVHHKPRLLRRILAATASSLFSLYIFLPPQPTVIEILMRLVASSVTVLICFGFDNPRTYLRRFFTFFAVSFIYAGLMAGIWMLFSPSVMSINNGIVYFDISPLWLIAASLLFYIAIILIKKLTGKDSEYAKRCDITLAYNDNKIQTVAMVDSGHSLTDGFSDSVVIVIDRSVAFVLFGKNDTDCMIRLELPKQSQIAKKYRLIPTNTVSGEGLLPAVRIDRAEISVNGNIKNIHKPTVVITSQKLSDDYSAIIPLTILNV